MKIKYKRPFKIGDSVKLTVGMGWYGKLIDINPKYDHDYKYLIEYPNGPEDTYSQTWVAEYEIMHV